MAAATLMEKVRSELILARSASILGGGDANKVSMLIQSCIAIGPACSGTAGSRAVPATGQVLVVDMTTATVDIGDMSGSRKSPKVGVTHAWRTCSHAKPHPTAHSCSSHRTANSSATPQEEKPAPVPSASLRELFQFATWVDGLLMLAGAVMALWTGAALPLFILFFSDLLDQVGQASIGASLTFEDLMQPCITMYILGGTAQLCGWFYALCFDLAKERQIGKLRKVRGMPVLGRHSRAALFGTADCIECLLSHAP